MPGGLLNLVSTGQENIILNSNPKKSFFRATYAKHTNFGLQKFRINYNKEKELSYINETEFTFKVARYADLLSDTFLCVTLPNIYSPIYINNSGAPTQPYEFQWVKHLGTTMIKEIEIYAGGLTLAKYSGEYIHCIAHRDLNGTKKSIFDRMIGHTKEMYDPANSDSLNGVYPTSFPDINTTTNNPEPSIRQRKIYIPLYSWFSGPTKCALPLVAIQYQEIFIKVTFRPVKELYTIIDVENATSSVKNRIAPNPNSEFHSIKRFIRKPDISEYDSNKFSNPTITTSNSWFSDIHLMSTYIFLDSAERNNFARKPISYLIKQVFENEFLKETGSKKIDVISAHCITNYMLRFRRDDAFKRNEWTNYTNWSFENVRQQSLKETTHFPITGEVGIYKKNMKNILLDMAIIVNGDYRENVLDNGIYLYCEKYTKTNGNFKEGLYHYSFALNTDFYNYQPTGCMNTSKYNKVTFEYNTITVPINEDATATFICGNDGELIGIRQDVTELNAYNFDFKVFEERYNVITIQNGNISLMLTN